MKKDRPQEEPQNKSRAEEVRQSDPEMTMRLTQRLYASYTESGLLIPNEVY